MAETVELGSNLTQLRYSFDNGLSQYLAFKSCDDSVVGSWNYTVGTSPKTCDKWNVAKLGNYVIFYPAEQFSMESYEYFPYSCNINGGLSSFGNIDQRRDLGCYYGTDKVFVPKEDVEFSGDLTKLFPPAHKDKLAIKIDNGDFTSSDSIGVSYLVGRSNINISAGSGDDSVNLDGYNPFLTLGGGADTLDVSKVINIVTVSDLSVTDSDVLVLDSSWESAQYNEATKTITFYGANNVEGAKIMLGGDSLKAIGALKTSGKAGKTQLKDYFAPGYFSPFTAGDDAPKDPIWS